MAKTASPSHQTKMAQNLPDFGELTISAPMPGKKGNIKQAQISLSTKPFNLILGPARVPFDIKPFNESDSTTRLNLHLTVADSECEKYFLDLDDKILKIVAANSMEFFGKELSEEHIKLMYKPMLPDNGTYDKTLKCKVNLEMPRKLKAWDEDKQQTELPTEWKNRSVVAAITIKSLYFVANMFGPTLEATDVMLCANDAMDVCPF